VAAIEAAEVVLGHADMADALLLSDEARWNQTAADWAVFIDHGQCFGVRDGGRLVATAAILPYGGGFGWVSMVLVTADWRRRGLASTLMSRCIAALRARGCAALLDATPEGALVYAQQGFRSQCGMARWRGMGFGKECGTIASATVGGGDLSYEALPPPLTPPHKAEGDFAAATSSETVEDWRQAGVPAGSPPPCGEGLGVGVSSSRVRQGRASSQGLPGEPTTANRAGILARDRQVSGGDRGFLLENFLGRPGTAVIGDNQCFVMMRQGRRATQIGPLIAGSDAEARDLLETALVAVSGPVILDVLEAGAGLNAVLEKRRFEAFRGFQRMVLDRPDLPGEPAALMVAAGPEFG
jgi:GNAT superfamily N-acetyltransferase